MLRKKNVYKKIDYENLGLLDSTLMHEVNRLGELAFIKKYRDIGYWIKTFDLNLVEINFFIGLISYFADKNNITIDFSEYKSLDKYVLNIIDFEFLFNFREKEVLKTCDVGCIPQFKNRGILKKEITEVF